MRILFVILSEAKDLTVGALREAPLHDNTWEILRAFALRMTDK